MDDLTIIIITIIIITIYTFFYKNIFYKNIEAEILKRIQFCVSVENL